MKKVIAVLLIVAFGGFQFAEAASAQNKKTERAAKRAVEFQEIKSLVEGGEYIFTPRSTTTTQGRRVDLTTSSYDFTTNGDSISSYLPFFGRAYTVTYGGGGGIECNGVAEDRSVSIEEEKMTIIVKSSTDSAKDNDSYDFTLTVSYNGYATLNVNSRNRASTSYFGEISAIEDEETDE